MSRCLNLNPVRGKRPLVERARVGLSRRYVDEGTVKPPANPLADVVEGWLLGGREFVERINRQLRWPQYGDEVPSALRLVAFPDAGLPRFSNLSAKVARLVFRHQTVRDVAQNVS